MDEYIEREKVTALIDYHQEEYCEAESYFGLLKEDFLQIPSADVQPVKHGKSIATDYDEVDQFVCSECGIELQNWVRVEHDEDDGDETYHEYRFNYCPNCGARNGW